MSLGRPFDLWIGFWKLGWLVCGVAAYAVEAGSVGLDASPL